jgi:putative methionine-R-sulfoxide reductase with GAF domain
VGSVMFLNPENNELTIKAAKGLPRDIVRNTRVKLGSQVSGIAVKEDRSFLLDAKVSDNRIKKYLKRPQISSSMVIPLKIQDKVLGVMNVGALDTSPVKFSPNNLKLMSRLLDLASLAIHA